jgi:hypothetical protein
MRSLALSLALVSVLGIGGVAAAKHGHEKGHGSHDKGSSGQGHHDTSQRLLAFGTMFGVDGPFVGDANPVDDIPGDELPWEIAFARGRLDTNGELHLVVRGVVFKDDPSVPEELRGINDETEFRAAVSCLTEDGAGGVKRQTVTTGGSPANEEGDSVIDAHVTLPDPCIAPAVFVLAGSEFKWFAVTGFETEE